jgi:hypothetical protein
MVYINFVELFHIPGIDTDPDPDPAKHRIQPDPDPDPNITLVESRKTTQLQIQQFFWEGFLTWPHIYHRQSNALISVAVSQDRSCRRSLDRMSLVQLALLLSCTCNNFRQEWGTAQEHE